MTHPNLTHWDDVAPEIGDAGDLGARRRDLGSAAGSFRAGVVLGELQPGRRAAPPHVHADGEELFYVMDGGGLSVQGDRAYAVAAGDCLLHRVHEEPHTLAAGEAGLTYLAFGPRSASNITWRPRAGVLRAGPLRPPAPEAVRPPTIAALASIPATEYDRGRVRQAIRSIGGALGAESTGMRHVRMAPGAHGTPHHCHGAEEELFVVLGGAGEVRLGEDRFAVARGLVLARPPGTGVAHSFIAGGEGLEYLGWGTREPNDICFYPDSGKVFLCGVGVIGRIEPVDYWDGEE
jgi:uncharacterized cupin superfamily protein